MKAKALWHISDNSSQIEEVELQNGKDVCLIQSYYSLISTGTERTVASGMVPDSQYQDMRVPFMLGNFDFPLTYGYSLVGKIVDGPNNYLNRYVHLLHPHQDYISVSKESFTIIPEAIPSKRATLTSNLETVVNAIWDGQVSMGDKILIIGYGIIGALLSHVLNKFMFAEVTILEKNATKCGLGLQSGFNIIQNPKDLDDDFDIAFNTSSSDSGLQIGIDHVGYEGKVIEISWYGNKKVTLELGKSFHSMRKQIISSQVSNIPGNRTTRWNHSRRKKLVFNLLKDKMFDQCISHEVDFSSSPTVFDKLRKNDISSLGIIIKY